MVHLIHFSTGLFDIAKETPNPINPIPGQGVLEWLRGKLDGSPYTASEPDAEDWGWCIDVTGNGSSYLVGACGEPNESSGMVDWILQVHKQRRLIEKLFGKNEMTRDDEFVALVAKLIQAEPAMQNVSFEFDS